VAPGGYHWHYIDGLSEDGEHAIVIIALIGNPFSPWYAHARDTAGSAPDALGYCSLNVALYGKRERAWALHERPIRAEQRTADGVSIGGSSMCWQGDRLCVEIDERTSPLGRPVRGRVILHPELLSGLALQIDGRGEHRWWPVAPLARIEVELSEPRLRFTGHGYYDVNAGRVPLEAAFDTWGWSRARSDETAYLTYDVVELTGARRSLAFKISARGEVSDLAPVWSTPLRTTLFGLRPEARVDHGQPCRVVRSLEDGPFYARSLVATRFEGRPVVAVHESLAAQRLRRGWVRWMVKHRMRRTADM
jgi:carotenoid 1,2-hydratase